MRSILGVGLLVATFTLAAADKAQEPIRFHANARVVLDEQGVPQQVQANEKLPPVVRDLVEQRVKQWRFEPARVDGEAKAGVTHVLLRGCGVPNAGGGMQIAMDYSSNGPGMAGGAVLLSPPRYPVDAARGSREGSFNVVFQVGANGRATVEKIEARTGSLKDFERALRDWVVAMRYVPEEVDGKPVATRIAMPVDFALGPDSMRRAAETAREETRRSPECAAAAGLDDEPRRPVVLNSPFRLRESG